MKTLAGYICWRLTGDTQLSSTPGVLFFTPSRSRLRTYFVSSDTTSSSLGFFPETASSLPSLSASLLAFPGAASSGRFLRTHTHTRTPRGLLFTGTFPKTPHGALPATRTPPSPPHPVLLAASAAAAFPLAAAGSASNTLKSSSPKASAIFCAPRSAPLLPAPPPSSPLSARPGASAGSASAAGTGRHGRPQQEAPRRGLGPRRLHRCRRHRRRPGAGSRRGRCRRRCC